MGSEAALLALLDHLYEAAVEPSAWGAALGLLAAQLGGVAAALYVMDATNKLRIHYTHNLPSGFITAYLVEWQERSPARTLAANEQAPMVQCDDLHNDEVAMADDDLDQWLSGFGLKYYLGGEVARCDELRASLLVFRAAGQRHTREEHVSLFRMLSPHLSRAVRFTLRYGALRTLANATREALEEMLVGVLVLDGCGRVLLANRVARLVLDRADALVVRDGELRALRASDDERMRGLLASTLTAARAPRGGGDMALARKSGAPDYALSVVPCTDDPAVLGALDSAALVLIGEPNLLPDIRPRALASLYGLTKRQTEVTKGLAAGATLDEVATTLGLSVKTVRAHLGEVFTKTGTARQSELMRLLLTSPARRVAGARAAHPPGRRASGSEYLWPHDRDK